MNTDNKLGPIQKTIVGAQFLFVAFGATVLVPAITGLNVSTTLLFAGLGTLLFHLITGRKVPAFLGSSFAFLGGFAAMGAMDSGIYAGMSGEEKLPYALGADIGRTVDYAAGRNRYIGYLISLAKNSYKGKKVGLDCANGSTWMIAKSVFDALEAGYPVIIAADAVSSRKESEKLLALETARQAGAWVLSTESILFALLKNSLNPAFKAVSKLIK